MAPFRGSPVIQTPNHVYYLSKAIFVLRIPEVPSWVNLWPLVPYEGLEQSHHWAC